MPERARVTSLEAVEAFRAALVLYRERAARVLDEAGEEVVRTRAWLQQDRLPHWQERIRRLSRELEQRQQELFTAQLSDLHGAPRPEQLAVQKARRALEQAEQRLRVVQHWNRQFDQRVEQPARHVDKLRHYLAHDLNLALGFLTEVLRTLSAYAELSPPGAQPATTTPSPEETPTP